MAAAADAERIASSEVPPNNVVVAHEHIKQPKPQQQKKQRKKQPKPQQQRKPKLMSCLAAGCKEFAFVGFFCPAHEHLDKLEDKLCLALGCKNERSDGYFCLVHSAKMAAVSSNSSRGGSEKPAASGSTATTAPPPPVEAVKRITEQSKSCAASDGKLLTAVDSPLHNQQMQPRKRRKTLCSHRGCIKSAQNPSALCWMHGAKDVICSFDGCKRGLCPDHGGLVQLCRWKGCISKQTQETIHCDCN